MLTTVDILLGVSVVMLIVSMAVMVITHTVIGLTDSRGKHLLTGLSDLLQQIDPALERPIAAKISIAVLTHPMIKGAGRQLGSTIHREEFTKLLMDLAAGNAPKDRLDNLGEDVKKALSTTLANNGINDPAKILNNVRSLALQLEMAHPEMATDARQALALMKEANSQLVAKINTWFDQTMDRVSDRFTQNTRAVTVACSLIVAFGIQLDTIALINRLSVDETFRESLVSEAIAMVSRPSPQAETVPAQSVNPGTNPAPDGNPRSPAKTEQNNELTRNIQSVAQLGVINVPSTPKAWWNQWSRVSVLGVLLTGLLVSLGAPFWYNALKQLLRLRSIIAGKDDVQRQLRQTTQTARDGGGEPHAAVPATGAGGDNLLTGERGILG